MMDNSGYEIGCKIGAFAGYVRRPLPSQSGMMSQIFGENGEDSDMVLALSLSKYVDTEVFVSVYLVKSADGELMKTEDGQFKMITSFAGYIRRSKALKDGMIAQFYAPNGVHADAIAELSKSQYQDCLVYVDVREGKGLNNQKQNNQPSTNYRQSQEEINQKYAQRITRKQAAEEKKKNRAYKAMNKELRFSNFLSQKEVVEKIGSKQDFEQWLNNTQVCCYHQSSSCMNMSHAVTPKAAIGYDGYRLLPLCEQHAQEIENKELNAEMINYFNMKYLLLLKEWGWSVIKDKFTVVEEVDVNPKAVIEWAKENGVFYLMPSSYQEV